MVASIIFRFICINTLLYTCIILDPTRRHFYILVILFKSQFYLNYRRHFLRPICVTPRITTLINLIYIFTCSLHNQLVFCLLTLDFIIIFIYFQSIFIDILKSKCYLNFINSSPSSYLCMYDSFLFFFFIFCCFFFFNLSHKIGNNLA